MSDQEELATLTSLVGLDEFEVVHATWNRREKLRRFELVPKTLIGLCPVCKCPTDRRHVCHDRVVEDLPMGDQRVELVVRLWQFECCQCRRYFTPGFAALAEGAHATERLLARLAELASRADVATAAGFFGIAEKTVEGWYYPYLQRKVGEPACGLQPVRSLGIDELSLKKDSASSSAC